MRRLWELGIGGFESPDAAVFPASLAEEFARHVSPLFDASPTAQGSFMGLSEVLRSLPVRPAQDFLTATQDGGGIYSVPDWTTPQWPGPDIFKKLQRDLFDFFAKRRHVARLRCESMCVMPVRSLCSYRGGSWPVAELMV